ncbi:hypothetical protein D3C84_1172020 [compost metagenome]
MPIREAAVQPMHLMGEVDRLLERLQHRIAHGRCFVLPGIRCQQGALRLAGGLAVEGLGQAGAQPFLGRIQQLEPLLVAGFQQLAGAL